MSGFAPTGLYSPKNANKSEVSSGSGTVFGGPGTSTSLLERRLTSDMERGSLFTNPRLNGPSNSSLGVSPLRVSPTIPISPSSAMAHRGPYSRPSLLDQSRPSTNRFTPYSRKPIFVGARRVDDKDSAEPHLTSTAQRIIDILQRNTTPVVEGLKKVPMHTSIKTLKPILKTVRGGPPITRSPYSLGDGSPKSLPLPPKYLLPKVPSGQPSPSTSTAVQQLPPTIAKTMPFAPVPLGSVSIEDFSYGGESKTSGGGKIKGKTTRIHEHPQQLRLPPVKDTPQPVAKELIVPVSTASSASSNVIVSMDSWDSGPTKFGMGKAWPSSLYDSGTTNLPNGYPEEDGFWKRLFAVVDEKDGNTTRSSTTPKPTFAVLTAPSASSDPTTWSCPTCLVSNKISELKCVCCREPQPVRIGSSSAGVASPELTTWPCPTCMVSNKLSELKCVCCTEARPAKYGDVTGPATPLTAKPVTTTPVTTTWPCPTCMVTNKLDDANCVCCTETRPAEYSAMTGTTKTSVVGATLPTSGFKFGFATQPTSTTSTPPLSSTSTFSFGVTDSKKAEAPPPIKFGVPSSVSADSAPLTIKFGVPPSTTGHSPSTGFQFGLNSNSSVPVKALEKSPMSADSFRKGFSFSSPTANGNTTKGLITSTSPSPTPPPIKFPLLTSVEEKKDPDAEIEKYKFKPFSGGPKPIATLPPPPELKTQVTFPTPTVFAPPAPVPISFGGNLTSAPPTINGGTDTVDKPKPAVGFHFGLSNSTPLTKTTGSVPSLTPFAFGVTTTAQIPAPTTTSTISGGFPFSGGPTTTTPTPAPALNFPFAAESHKRKAPSEETPGGGFMFNPSEPKLKMRMGADGTNTAVSPSMTPGGGMKTGSFLDAMKQPGFGSVDKPDGKLMNNAFSANNNISSSGFTNPNAGFQFQPLVPPPPVTSNPVASSGGFSFGGTQFPAPLPAPTLNNNIGGLFAFGSQPSPTPQFNLVPNLSFTQNSGVPPSSAPVLFSAGAPPASQVNDIGRRPTKKAVRRLR